MVKSLLGLLGFGAPPWRRWSVPSLPALVTGLKQSHQGHAMETTSFPRSLSSTRGLTDIHRKDYQPVASSLSHSVSRSFHFLPSQLGVFFSSTRLSCLSSSNQWKRDSLVCRSNHQCYQSNRFDFIFLFKNTRVFSTKKTGNSFLGDFPT